MREMKDSGLEWLGNVSSDVKLVPLKYLLKKERMPIKVGPFGSQLSGTDFLKEESDFWVYNQRIVLDENYEAGDAYISSEKYETMIGFHVYEDDILITTRGTIGKISRIPHIHKPGILHPCIIRFRIDDSLYDYRLLKLIFNQSDFVTEQILYKSNATTIEVIYRDTLKNIILPVWDMQTQRKIADFLDTKCSEIDALTADIQTQIDTLEQYKRSIITEAVTRGLNPDVEMKDGGNQYWGSIPTNWHLSDIKYLFEIVKRIAGKEGYDILSVTQKGIKIKDISNNEGQVAESYANYQFVYPGDFVMNHMDLLTGWVDCSKLFGVTSPDYRVFRLRDKNNSLNYYKYIMQTCYMNRIFYSLGQGVSNLGRWRLQTSSFNNFMVPVPPVEVQESIATYLDKKCTEINACIDDKQRQLEVLEEYRKLGKCYDYVCCMYPTAPFITSNEILEAMEKMEKYNPAVVIPVVPFSYPPQRCFVIDKQGYAKFKYPQYVQTRSQDLEKQYHDAGQFYVYNVKKLIEQKGIIEENFMPIILSELQVQDIDTEDDWKIAEVKYKMLAM